MSRFDNGETGENPLLEELLLSWVWFYNKTHHKRGFATCTSPLARVLSVIHFTEAHMNIQFKWSNANYLEANKQAEFEKAVRDDINLESDDRAKPCHIGDLLVELSVTDPLLNKVVGNVKCNCGACYLIIDGTVNKNIIYSIV
ncbi:hypothetical protein [Shewanella seohaensis]|uniref:hypothetical protein n=1 Tax=Shewanella seohaensis TaxID=755175 RepID=UPI0035B9ABE9